MAAGQAGLEGVKQRVLLGVLALAANTVVVREALIDVLWGEEPPATAVSLLQGYAGRLRRVLDPGRPARDPAGTLVTVGAGYRLQVSRRQLDLLAFADLAGKARAARARGAAGEVCEAYEQALGLWRGQVLAGTDALKNHPAVIEVSRRRAAVICDYADAAGDAGRPGRVLAHLWDLAGREPLDEKVHARLMIALAATGQQAAALNLYDELRHRLDDQLGVGPGAELAAAHLRILRQQIRAAAPVQAPPTARTAGPDAAPVVVPRQLPAAIAHFAGRATELKILSALLDQAHAGNKTVVISAIGGTAGVGKTALALHWAHQAADRFPDGQLYVNLRGYHPTAAPMEPGEAVRSFLDALNVPPSRIPVSLEAQIMLYRSLLADKHMLVLLDNARDAQHARPLLPGLAGCFVIITSRSQLAGLASAEGAHLLNLGLLSEAEARELLVDRLALARVAAEPDAVEKLAGLCAGLPLALSIVAGRSAARPAVPLAAFITELRDNQALLDALDAGDAAASVRAVFSWSYQNLSDQAARMFRMLGTHPGPDISAAAAARLADVSSREARRLLNELTNVHILTDHTGGRFAFHDLLRAYAIEEARTRDSNSDRQAALRRVLDYYMSTAHEAAVLLNPSRDILTLPQHLAEAMSPEVKNDTEALAWFEAEHAVLLTAITHAAKAGFDSCIGQISWSLADYFDRRGHWRDWAATQRFAVAAARRTGDRAALARACRGLGRAYTELRAYQDASSQLRRAADLYGQLGDPIGQGRTRLALARLREYQNEHALALDEAQMALTLFHTARYRAGQASARNAVGWHQAHLGNHGQALSDCQQALALYRRLADSRGMGVTNDSLGYVYHQVGDHARARRCYQDAVDLFRGLGDKYNEASSLSRLGDVQMDTGDTAAARARWQEALAILSDLDHPDLEEVSTKLRDTS